MTILCIFYIIFSLYSKQRLCFTWKLQILCRLSDSLLYTGWFSSKDQYFLEVIISVIVRKKRVHMNMGLILNVYWDRAVWIYRSNSVNICLWFWMKSEVYKRKANIRGELLARILDDAAGIRNLLRSTQTNSTRSPYTSCKLHWRWRWDFQTFIVICNKWTVTNSSFVC